MKKGLFLAYYFLLSLRYPLLGRVFGLKKELDIVAEEIGKN